MIKVVIFDVDGTLINTIGCIKGGGDKALERLGYDRLPVEKYKEFVGHGAGALVEKMMEYYGDYDRKHFETVFDTVTGHLKRSYNDACAVYVGMYDTVYEVKLKGAKLAVLSNKLQKAAEGNIYHFFGRDLFDKIVGDSETFIRKPDPIEALKIAIEFDALPFECVIVGDSEADILAAKYAGMKSVACTWGYRSKEELLEHEPDFIIDNHTELPGIIDELNSK